MSRLPTVSIVVPAHRDGPALRACMASLAAVDPPPDELLVAVDGAQAEAIETANRHGARVLALAERGGPARARNAAVAAATGDVVLFIDSDVTVRPSIVARVRDAFAAGDVDAIIGSYDDTPAAGNTLSQYKNLLNHYVHQNASDDGFTFWGACGAIRRQAFLAVGGFDERRYPRPSVEDIDLGYRLRAAGHRIRVAKQVQVTHLKRWDAASLLRSDVCDRALPWAELILDSGTFHDDLNINRAGRAKVAVTWVTALAAVAGMARPRALGAGAAGIAAAGVATLLTADRGLLAFFARRHGPGFAAAAMAWHALSYGYSGAAFGVAVARHWRRRLARRSRA